MGFVVAITGPIGAGKSTLCARLSAEYSAVHLGSDAVRLALSHRARRSGDRVFAELSRRFERALAAQRAVLLDSTGMSPRFRALLRAHRDDLVHVHLRLDDERRFEERECGRTDRPEGALSLAAFRRSRRVEFPDAPDLVVATDDLTADQTYRQVAGFLRTAFP